MDSARAREVLRLYRPGTTDAMDPHMAEALQAIQRDPELAKWFDEHCGNYIAIRSKLKQIEVPADLKRRILLENAAREKVSAFPSLATWLAAASVLVLVAVGVWRMVQPAKPVYSFADFEQRVVREAQRGYAMEMHAASQSDIHDYLRAKRWVSDYTIPKPMEKLPALGCSAGLWHDRKYSMVCLLAGKTADGRQNDLWLFAASRSDFTPNSLPAGKVRYDTILHRTAATWSDGDKVYILAGLGDSTELQQYLENN